MAPRSQRQQLIEQLRDIDTQLNIKQIPYQNLGQTAKLIRDLVNNNPLLLNEEEQSEAMVMVYLIEAVATNYNQEQYQKYFIDNQMTFNFKSFFEQNKNPPQPLDQPQNDLNTNIQIERVLNDGQINEGQRNGGQRNDGQRNVRQRNIGQRGTLSTQDQEELMRKLSKKMVDDVLGKTIDEAQTIIKNYIDRADTIPSYQKEAVTASIVSYYTELFKRSEAGQLPSSRLSGLLKKRIVTFLLSPADLRNNQGILYNKRIESMIQNIPINIMQTAYKLKDGSFAVFFQPGVKEQWVLAIFTDKDRKETFQSIIKIGKNTIKSFVQKGESIEFIQQLQEKMKSNKLNIIKKQIQTPREAVNRRRLKKARIKHADGQIVKFLRTGKKEDVQSHQKFALSADDDERRIQLASQFSNDRKQKISAGIKKLTDLIKQKSAAFPQGQDQAEFLDNAYGYLDGSLTKEEYTQKQYQEKRQGMKQNLNQKIEFEDLNKEFK